MKVEQAALVWGVSSKSVYRLVDDGTLAHTIKPRDKPLTRIEIDEGLVNSVRAVADKRQLALTPQVIKEIINSM